MCVLGYKQGPPTTTPLHTAIVTLAVVVPFAVDAAKFIFGITEMLSIALFLA
jgi:hypothetical protein